MEATSASEGKDPSAFLGEITGAPVTVKLNSGVVYKGASSSCSYRPHIMAVVVRKIRSNSSV